tara:strand:- start:473 stop:724 length:252 start_codon:yes stop_codon:yes gene_type:complete
MTKIKINGAVYYTYAEAAKATGWAITTIWRHNQNNTLHKIGEGKTSPKKVEANGVKYKSIREAARVLNITFEVFRKKFYKGNI